MARRGGDGALPPGEELSASRGHVIGGQHLILLPNPCYPASHFLCFLLSTQPHPLTAYLNS